MEHLSAQTKFGNANGTASGRNDWHTAFYEALQIELREYQNVLEFHYQHRAGYARHSRVDDYMQHALAQIKATV
jgi:hypothetical protein